MEGVKSGGGFSPPVYGLRAPGDGSQKIGGKELPGNKERIEGANLFPSLFLVAYIQETLYHNRIFFGLLSGFIMGGSVIMSPLWILSVIASKVIAYTPEWIFWIFLAVMTFLAIKKKMKEVFFLGFVITAVMTFFQFFYDNTKMLKPVDEDWLYGRSVEEVEFRYYCPDNFASWEQSTKSGYIPLIKYRYDDVNGYYYIYCVLLDEERRIIDFYTRDTGIGG